MQTTCCEIGGQVSKLEPGSSSRGTRVKAAQGTSSHCAWIIAGWRRLLQAKGGGGRDRGRRHGM